MIAMSRLVFTSEVVESNKVVGVGEGVGSEDDDVGNGAEGIGGRGDC